MKKILVVTPSFPFPPTGAEQADRAQGLYQLRRLGFDLKVITKVTAKQSPQEIEKVAADLDISITPVSYKFSNRALSRGERLKKIFSKLRNPLLLDGAALEYREPEMTKVFLHELAVWRPDIAWFEYTYLWPLYSYAVRAGVKIITRSINFEPSHFLQEDGATPFNLLKSLPKYLGEYISVKKSDHVFSITPHEEAIYRRLGAKSVSNLPLRGLPLCLRQAHPIRETRPLNVFFFGSTYNVSHNRRALEFILKDLAPWMGKNYPGEFLFHVLGSKVPEAYEKYFGESVTYEGAKYGQELDDFLAGMDIALIPSFFGAGMQQKIFEPLCRGIPLVTDRRGIAGYPFEDKTHVQFAATLKEFAAALMRLRDPEIRAKLSGESSRLAAKIFSQEKIDGIVREALARI